MKTSTNLWTSAQLVQLGQTLETAYGAGVLAEPAAPEKSGWTLRQLLNLAAARAFSGNPSA